MSMINSNNFYYQNTINNLSFTLGSVIQLSTREKVEKKKISKYVFSKPQDNYQVYNSNQVNGWITNRIFFINGQRCDAFGRTVVDPGFEGLKKELSYPNPLHNMNSKVKKSKRYNQVGGIDSNLNLDINKSNNNYFYTLEKLKKLNKLESLNFNNENNNSVSNKDIHKDLSKYLINHFNSFQNRALGEKNYQKKVSIINFRPVLENNIIPYNFISPPPKFKIDNLLV